MTTTCTPGPWCTGEPFAVFDGADLKFHISQAEGAPYTPHYSDVTQFVAETIPGEKLDIQRANARLIAAAPELLEALRAEEEWRARQADGAIDPDWDYETMVATKRRAAIAKATGEQS